MVNLTKEKTPSKLFIVQKRQKYASFNANGRQLSKFNYDTIYPPTCDKPVKLLLAKKRMKYGYLDEGSIERLAFIYVNAKPFCRGIAKVKRRYSMNIDYFGKVVVNSKGEVMVFLKMKVQSIL
ncbi:MAG TPA: hypothetical protein DCS93_30730 [Microscillaceae bacterium]|nr:hypothetical protein [Microscillaceae bacterium]